MHLGSAQRTLGKNVLEDAHRRALGAASPGASQRPASRQCGHCFPISKGDTTRPGSRRALLWAHGPAVLSWAVTPAQGEASPPCTAGAARSPLPPSCSQMFGDG